MKPANIPLDIYQGATFRHRLTWSVDGVLVNLTGYTGIMQLRISPESAAVILELTTENNGIVINPLIGQIDLFISATDTSLLDFNQPVLYDLELILAAEVVRLCGGQVNLHKEITRAV